MKEILISYHGGHSGDFCDHAEDLLEDVVLAYIKKGFKNFGIADHQPRTEEFLYQNEIDLGHNSTDLFFAFDEYVKKAKSLQKKYRMNANILVGFETDMCGKNPLKLIDDLRSRYGPDYIVGSVHHVKNVSFYNKEYYEQAIKICGSLEKLYENYYELQYDLIMECKPEVIGHFDFIKLFSEDFEPSENVIKLMERNIEAVISYGGVFEVNSRAFKKGLKEPFPGRKILKMIKEMDGLITLGDDSHSASQVGLHYDKMIPIVKEFFDEVVAFKRTERGIEKVFYKI